MDFGKFVTGFLVVMGVGEFGSPLFSRCSCVTKGKDVRSHEVTPEL